MIQECPGSGRHKSGCRPCNAYAAARMKKVRRRKAYGTFVPYEENRTDATSLRELFSTLLEHGITRDKIAKHYGIHFNTVKKILEGQKTVRRKVEEKVMGMDMPLTPNFVPRVGTIRRLHALAYRGFSIRDVLKEIFEYTSLPYHHACQYIRWETAQTVKEYYDRHCMSLGPSKITQRRAMLWAQGPQRPGFEWASPLAWDGIDMDDPQARPRGVRRYARIERKRK